MARLHSLVVYVSISCVHSAQYRVNYHMLFLRAWYMFEHIFSDILQVYMYNWSKTYKMSYAIIYITIKTSICRSINIH